MGFGLTIFLETERLMGVAPERIALAREANGSSPLPTFCPGTGREWVLGWGVLLLLLLGLLALEEEKEKKGMDEQLDR